MIIFAIFTLKLVTVTNFSFGLINARLERYLLYEKHKDELEQKKIKSSKKNKLHLFSSIILFSHRKSSKKTESDISTSLKKRLKLITEQ